MSFIEAHLRSLVDQGRRIPLDDHVDVLYVSSLLTGDRRSHISHLTIYGHVAEDCMIQVEAAKGGWMESPAMKSSATRPWAVR